MAAPLSAPRGPLPLLALGLLMAIGAGAAGYELAALNRNAQQLTAEVARQDAILQEIFGEITRLRLEQTTGTPGPKGLLRRLEQFAALASTSRVTEPDYQAAKKEMDAILRALASIGEDAWEPVQERLRALDPGKQFDEVKWLLDAAVAIDRERGVEIYKNVLLGLHLPAPRLRWYAARRLTELERPLAQQLLRQILTTESSRGPDLERAKSYGMTVPDPAAYAISGFDNFVNYYLGTEDPETEPTLLMVLARTEHDVITLQTCIEALGSRRSELAIEPIRHLYQHPPGGFDNPIFRTKCLDALAAIQGAEARPFFEAMLARAENPRVADHLKNLLARRP